MLRNMAFSIHSILHWAIILLGGLVLLGDALPSGGLIALLAYLFQLGGLLVLARKLRRKVDAPSGSSQRLSDATQKLLIHTKVATEATRREVQALWAALPDMLAAHSDREALREVHHALLYMRADVSKLQRQIQSWAVSHEAAPDLRLSSQTKPAEPPPTPPTQDLRATGGAAVQVVAQPALTSTLRALPLALTGAALAVPLTLIGAPLPSVSLLGLSLGGFWQSAQTAPEPRLAPLSAPPDPRPKSSKTPARDRLWCFLEAHPEAAECYSQRELCVAADVGKGTVHRVLQVWRAA